MNGIGDRNLERFDDPEVVRDYVSATALTPSESTLFRTHVAPGARILDLGVGTGRTTGWLCEHGSTYVGIDYAPRMVEAAAELHPGVDFRVGDAADLSAFDAGSFDVVVFSYNGIDYLDDGARARCLDEIHRVLVPGGRFLFSTHNPRALLVTGSKVRGSFVKRQAAATLMTARRARRRLADPVFRAGHGWILDLARGGLLTHVATPSRVGRELTRHRFALVETVNGDRPRRGSSLRTPWWYYAATATGDRAGSGSSMSSSTRDRMHLPGRSRDERRSVRRTG